MKKFLPVLFALLFFIPVVKVHAADYVSPTYIKASSLLDQTYTYDSVSRPYTDVILPYEIGGSFVPSLTKKVYMKIGVPDGVDRIHVSTTTGSTANAVLLFVDSDSKLLSQKQLFYNQKDFSFNLPVGTKTIYIDKNSVTNQVRIDTLNFSDSLNIILDPVTNLTESHGSNDVTLKWKNPVSSDLQAIVIKKDGVVITELAKTAEIYTTNSLASDLTYDFQVIAKYTGDKLSQPKSISVKTDPLPEDLTPPGEVSMVASENTHNTVTLTWKNPLDTDFLEVRIYRNGELIIDHLKGTKFVDTNLVPNTTYTYKIVAVDTSQNNSSGYLQTIKTDIEKDLTPPAPPTNVVTTAGNASLSVKWKANAESDLKGYNVYVNGVKHNDVVIFANSYVVPSLTNGITYNITVTAVDTSENESLPSGQSSVAPDQSAMPIMQAKYNLKDVSDGTSNWFTTLWPILAFAVGIPLAFYISNRIKTLFFA